MTKTEKKILLACVCSDTGQYTITSAYGKGKKGGVIHSPNSRLVAAADKLESEDMLNCISFVKEKDGWQNSVRYFNRTYKITMKGRQALADQLEKEDSQ